jgi:hypothetical protein
MLIAENACLIKEKSTLFDIEKSQFLFQPTWDLFAISSDSHFMIWHILVAE